MPNATKTVVILCHSNPAGRHWNPCVTEKECHWPGWPLTWDSLTQPSSLVQHRSIWGVLEGHLVPSPFHVALNQRSST